MTDVRAMLSDVVLMTKARLLAIPPRLAIDILGESSRVMIQAKIERAIKDALNQLADDGSNYPKRGGESPEKTRDFPRRGPPRTPAKGAHHFPAPNNFSLRRGIAVKFTIRNLPRGSVMLYLSIVPMIFFKSSALDAGYINARNPAARAVSSMISRASKPP